MRYRVILCLWPVLAASFLVVTPDVVAQTSRTSSNEITDFNDWYEGDTGLDEVELLAGDDVFMGNAGNDTASGGAGDDMLDGGPGDDLLHGDDGNDRLFGATGADRLFGGQGDDLLAGGDGSDELGGGDGGDSMRGGNGDDVLVGGDGDDRIRGDRGGDRLEGGQGSDVYVFQFEDDLPFESQSRTEIVDSSGEGNQIAFIGGMQAEDVILIWNSGEADIEIQYGYAEMPMKSSVFVLDGANGEVITQFRFSDGQTMSFEQLCQANSDTCE